MNDFYVFVYGTLLKGFGNHRILRDGDAEFLGKATVEGYRIFGGSVPFAFATNNPEDKLEGEVYLVDMRTLKNLDILEGNGRFYHRTPVSVVLETGEKITVGMYIVHSQPQPGTPTFTSFRKLREDLKTRLSQRGSSLTGGAW